MNDDSGGNDSSEEDRSASPSPCDGWLAPPCAIRYAAVERKRATRKATLHIDYDDDALPARGEGVGEEKKR